MFDALISSGSSSMRSILKFTLIRTGVIGGNKAMGRSKGCLIPKYIGPWMRWACLSESLKKSDFQLTTGTTADCGHASKRIDGLSGLHLLAEKPYGSQDFVDFAQPQGITAVIPPRKNRKDTRFFDKDLYTFRHLVENAFLHLKRWRGIATRYAKKTSSFLAAVHMRCSALWSNVS